MPEAASPGAGTIVIEPPQGPVISQPVSIARTGPGVYFDVGTGAPSGYAADRSGNLFPLVTCQRGCTITHLPLSSTLGGLDVALYGTGIRAASGPVKLRIGTHTLDSATVRQHPTVAGVDELNFHLPQDFPLRLYQVISAETAEGASNYSWIYLE
jgi:hypothetical protein